MPNSSSSPTNRPSTFAERIGIGTRRRQDQIRDVLAEIEGRGLHSVRLACVDLHGVLRGKSLRADLIKDVFDSGLGLTSAVLMKDTGQNNVYPVWAAGAGLDRSWLTGAGDVIMVPDPTTFRVLPWADGSGWLLCDLFSPEGESVEFSTRALCRRAEQALTDHGYEYRAGLEMEFHLYAVSSHSADTTRAPDAVGDLKLDHLHPGYVYLGEQRYDTIEPFLEILRADLHAIGAAPRSMELELGPSQVELTFSPVGGLELADQAVLVRSAIKQIARRNGLHATFMGRPAFAQSFSSGWHLHQSLLDAETGSSCFPIDDGTTLSPIGRHYLAGLLDHASESCLLTTPTVTGYKRYRPNSLAPDRIGWSAQNRGAMLRIVGTDGDPATRIENRVGDSAANPYLYLASQMLCGLDGIEKGISPPSSTDSPYAAESDPLLPRTLGEAIEVFRASGFYRDALGPLFVDYLATSKQAEWDRFLATVTDWEQREYFDLF